MKMRYTLKTKTIHGVRTGRHDNPHVVKAAGMKQRRDGGMCDGDSAPRNLGRMGRMKPRADGGCAGGGAISDQDMKMMGAAPGRGKTPGTASAEITGTSPGRGRAEGTDSSMLGAVREAMGERPGRADGGISWSGLGQGLSNLSTLGLPQQNQQQQLKNAEDSPATALGKSLSAISGLGAGRRHGGKVDASSVGKSEIAQHRKEHAAMAEEGRKDGGRLTAAERHALPKKDFALSGERYPINDASHARNALARVSQHGTPEEKAKVRSKVASKYPGIEQKD
jgi:hypothetical protein